MPANPTILPHFSASSTINFAAPRVGSQARLLTRRRGSTSPLAALRLCCKRHGHPHVQHHHGFLPSEPLRARPAPAGTKRKLNSHTAVLVRLLHDRNGHVPEPGSSAANDCMLGTSLM